MAYGVPCVVIDAGVSVLIVGNTGRVEENFSLPVIVARYESLYKEVLRHDGLTGVRTESV